MPRSAPITQDVARAGRALAAGQLVGLPTETVYGLAADATNPVAVRAIFAAKQRPAGSPLIVHVAAADDIAAWVQDMPAWAHALGEAFWPGPLTLVLQSNRRAASEVTAGGATVALRVPDHPLARAVIAASGTGLAAPSANRHGAVSPTRADHVAETFDAATVSCVLDGGPCLIGIESTIVDCTEAAPVVLRHGGVSLRDVERVAGLPTVERIERIDLAGWSDARTPAPGQARSHYAPRARVELQQTAAGALARYHELAAKGERVALLLGEAIPHPEVPDQDVFIDTGDDAEFAHELYGAMRRADGVGVDTMIVVVPTRGGLSAAVQDRMERAAAPRPGPP